MSEWRVPKVCGMAGSWKRCGTVPIHSMSAGLLSFPAQGIAWRWPGIARELLGRCDLTTHEGARWWFPRQWSTFSAPSARMDDQGRPGIRRGIAYSTPQLRCCSTTGRFGSRDREGARNRHTAESGCFFGGQFTPSPIGVVPSRSSPHILALPRSIDTRPRW